MLWVQLVEEYQRGDEVHAPGRVLRLDVVEARRLIENGLAVPTVGSAFARETR